MDQSDTTLISQIYCYPYKRVPGSASFESNHEGYSKLTLYQSSTAKYGYNIVVMRIDDLVMLDRFDLLPDFKIRFTDQFLVMICNSVDLLAGFGTPGDEEAIEDAQEFVRSVQEIVLRINEDLISTSQSRTTNANTNDILEEQNLDVLNALSSSTSATTPSASARNYGTLRLRTPTLTHQLSSSSHQLDKSSSEVSFDQSRSSKKRLSIAHTPEAIPSEVMISDNTSPTLSGTDKAYNDTVGRIGLLDVLPTKQEQSQQSGSKGDRISKPYKVEHKTHISFGKDGFKGVPQEWIKELKRQFSIEWTHLPGSLVPGYQSKIPYVLQTLRDLLIDKGGLETVGIFRLAPQSDHCDAAKADVDNGLLIGVEAVRDENGKLIFDYDVHVVANLIKIWLRDLPTPVLDKINKGKVEHCKNDDEAWAILQELPEPALSLCKYLIDFFVLVASYHHINKMPPQNIAICFCPNLFRGNPDDPMATLVHTQKVSKWLQMVINYRIEHPDPNVEIDEHPSLTFVPSTDENVSVLGVPVSIPKTAGKEHETATQPQQSQSQPQPQPQPQPQQQQQQQQPTDTKPTSTATTTTPSPAGNTNLVSSPSGTSTPSGDKANQTAATTNANANTNTNNNNSRPSSASSPGARRRRSRRKR